MTRTSSSALAGTASCPWRRAPTRASSHTRLSEACAGGCWCSDVLPGEAASGCRPASEPGACRSGCFETAAASTCSSSRSGCWLSACSAAREALLLLPAKSSAAGGRSASRQEPSQDGRVGRMGQGHMQHWAPN